MSEPPPLYADRVRGCLLGALAGGGAVVEDLLIAAECVAETGGLDDDALRQAGLGVAPPAGVAGVVLRTIPYALLTPGDRPRLRLGAHRCATAAHVDDGAVVTAVAVAVIASDLARGFDIDTALVRCHQTLLEEAPAALLARLRCLPEDAELSGDADPTVALQLAITALSRAEGASACVAVLAGGELQIAPALAGALAGIRDGMTGLNAGQIDGHALRARADAAAGVLAAVATPADPLPSEVG